MAKMHTKRELTRKQQKTIGITAISIAVVLLAVIVIFVGIPLVKFLKEPERFRSWVDERGFGG